jgi:DNA-binding IclR family transcriptional regulator
VFHLLKTMMGLRYIRQAEDSKRYMISSALFCLAAAARSEVQALAIANPLIRELALLSGNTALFGMRSGDEMIIVSKAEGNGVFQMSDRVGGVRPAHCTGMGKVMLASLSAARLEQYLSACELVAYTPNTITDRGRLLEELAEIRRSGIAFDDAEFHPELRCVAGAVRDFTGEVVGALAMSGPAWRLSLQALQKRTVLLRETTERLSAALGFRGDQEAAARGASQAGHVPGPARNENALTG